jgi:hypothetical protein
VGIPGSSPAQQPASNSAVIHNPTPKPLHF